MHSLLLVVGEQVDRQLEPFADWNDSGDNPNTKFDWYKIGGRWDGYLQLLSPRMSRKLLGLLKPRVEQRVNVAKKEEIDAAALLASPPVAVLVDGRWTEAEIRIDEPADDSWRSTFKDIFDALPDDATLTVVDIHS